MPRKRKEIILNFIRGQFAALSTLLVLASLSVLGYYELKERTEENYRRQFSFRARLAVNALESRINDYLQILKGSKGLIHATDTFSRQQWVRYMETFNLQRNFPGLQGIGYARYVRNHEVEKVVETIRADGYSEFTIHPVGEREVYVPIVYLEPMDWRNQRAIGYDMFVEPVRREALQRARDKNQPALSGKVILIQETSKDVQAGFLIYLPVYNLDSLPLNASDAGRKIRGYVYSPFRANDFAQDIFRDHFNDIDIEIFDGVNPNESTLLYTKDKLIDYNIQEQASLSQLSHLNMAGRTWTIYITPRPLFWTNINLNQPLIVLVTGLVISVLISMIIWSLAKTRQEIHLKQTMAENASAGLFMLNLSGYCNYLNPSARALTGYDISQVQHKPVWEFLGADARENQELKHMLKQGHNVRNRELCLQGISGNQFNAAVSKTLVLRNDRPDSIILEVRDITREKRALREAIENANRFRFLANTMPEKVYTASPEGKITYLNQRWFESGGSDLAQNPNDLEGVWQLVHKDDLEQLSHSWKKSILNETVFETQYRALSADGTYHWHLSRAIPQYNEEGRLIMWIGVSTDIHDQKTNEELIRKNAEQIAMINEELNDFASVVSHDLKAPLRAIGTLADFLMMDCDYLKEKDRENLKLIKERVKRMETLIHGILRYSRLSKDVVEYESVNLNELVDDVVQYLKPPKHIKIEVNDLPTVNFVRTQLFQLFQNIIDNAIKYNDKEQGLITVSARYTDHEVQVIVEDNGPGVEEKYYQRIFKMFQTLTPRDKRESTGIGLTIVQKIMKNMQGRVWLESEVGKGTRVLFSFPVTLLADNVPQQADSNQ